MAMLMIYMFSQITVHTSSVVTMWTLKRFFSGMWSNMDFHIRKFWHHFWTEWTNVVSWLNSDWKNHLQKKKIVGKYVLLLSYLISEFKLFISVSIFNAIGGQKIQWKFYTHEVKQRYRGKLQLPIFKLWILILIQSTAQNKLD